MAKSQILEKVAKIGVDVYRRNTKHPHVARHPGRPEIGADARRSSRRPRPPQRLATSPQVHRPRGPGAWAAPLQRESMPAVSRWRIFSPSRGLLYYYLSRVTSTRSKPRKKLRKVRIARSRAAPPFSLPFFARTMLRKPRCEIEGVDRLRHACGRAVAAAVVRRAEMRAALGHLARDLHVGLARVEALFARRAAWVSRSAARAVDRRMLLVPVRRPLPDIAGHVEEVRSRWPETSPLARCTRSRRP